MVSENNNPTPVGGTPLFACCERTKLVSKSEIKSQGPLRSSILSFRLKMPMICLKKMPPTKMAFTLIN